jgi:hypothetical protein
MLLVPPFPVHGDVHRAVLHIIEELSDGVFGGEFSNADFFGVAGGDQDQGIIGQDLDAIDSEGFSVIGLDLNALDETDSLIGINDFIPNFETIHEKVIIMNLRR